MSRKFLNLVLMGVWLTIGGAILARDYLPDNLRVWKGGNNEDYQTMLGLFALAMGVYNFIRWYSARSLERGTPEVVMNPLARDRADRAPEPYTGPNPDFDFVKVPETGGPPKPSANGDHK